MLGLCAISVEGRTLYANVPLREHHVVRRDGACFLLLVDEMTASPLDRALADALGRLAFYPGTLVPERLMGALRGAGLVAGEGTGAGEPAVPDATADGGAQDRPALGAVTSLALFLAQSCNLACSYCYGAGGSYGGGGLMSSKTARAGVDWLFANAGGERKVHISFFGGEPLLNLPLLKEVVAYARERATAESKDVTFGITTNATLVDEEVAAYLAAERISPLVSCDGPPAVHDHQRPFADGRGSHAAVMTGAARLREAFPGLMARATLCGETDPFAVRRGLEEAGFTRCSLTAASPVLLRENEEGAGGAPAHDPAREAQAARLLAYRRAEVAELFAALSARSLDPERPPDALYRLAGLARGQKRRAACGLGRGMRALSVNGDIYPCHRFVGLADSRMGDLGNYRSAGLNDYHRAIVENLPLCHSCWARYFCGGGCFYENRARSGDMRRPDPLFCGERRAVTGDLIAGWCRLSDEEQAYARAQIEQMARADQP